MSKVIIFSRSFPSYHPRKGEPTDFVEGMYHSIPTPISYKLICDLNNIDMWEFWKSLNQEYSKVKYHTIRPGTRFKVGDMFSPRVWSGKPYRTKQIVVAPDMKVTRVWDIEIAIGLQGIRINGDWYFEKYEWLVERLSENDGLSIKDFKDWFGNTESFIGQIICWEPSIEY